MEARISMKKLSRKDMKHAIPSVAMGSKHALNAKCAQVLTGAARELLVEWGELNGFNLKLSGNEVYHTA